MLSQERFAPGVLNTPFLFFTGKGGVGKTSIASATAVALARSGKKVLIVSTDPASNLDDVFQVPLCADPVAIPYVDGLFAANLDPEEAARNYREKIVGPYRGILPEAAITSIEEQLSGACTVEIAAFDEFSKLLASPDTTGQYDHIVLDTAPTGHTLRLLQLPKAWTGFMQESQHGASCLGPLAGLGDKKDLYASTLAALSDSRRTTLVLVARPDHSALAEAARAASELKELGIQNQQLILNGLLIEPGNDPIAQLFLARQRTALQQLPEPLPFLPTTYVPLSPIGLTGVKALETLLQPQESPSVPSVSQDSTDIPEYLAPILEHLSGKSHGVIMTMGKGGVGKTTIAAAIAVGLADRGHHVHLTTTDPAAHLEFALGDSGSGEKFTVSRIDPKAVTDVYRQEVMEEQAPHLDDEGMALLEEDLASPCTEEIAVFRAFADTVSQASNGFVVMDTAPTGHTLLLLDAAEAYHREVLRSTGDIPEHVRSLLPRLRNPEETDVILVTLPEATPVLEAERLQADLRRAGIGPSWWVVNQSWQNVDTVHPILRNRSMAEKPWLIHVSQIAKQRTWVPWMPEEPVGAAQLRKLIAPLENESMQERRIPLLSRNYQALVEDKIFFGGANDVEDMVKNEGIEVVVDLREEATGCAYPDAPVEWIKIPLGDHATEPEAELFQAAIQEVVTAYRGGKKVAFHCGGGKGRTGAVAVGTLRELGLAATLEEAEAQAKAIRPLIAVKPKQWEALKTIFE